MASMDVRGGVVTQSLLLTLIDSIEREEKMYVQAGRLNLLLSSFLMNTVSKLKILTFKVLFSKALYCFMLNVQGIAIIIT